MQGQELHMRILVGSFQLSKFSDSVTSLFLDEFSLFTYWCIKISAALKWVPVKKLPLKVVSVPMNES